MHLTGSKGGLLAIVLTTALTLSCGSKGVSDQALTTDIQSKLYADATTKGGNIQVAVKDGVATLTGEVPNSDVELQAVKLANSATGVQRVQDQIKINPSLAANQPLPAPAPEPASPPPAEKPAPKKSSSAASTPPAGSAPPPAASAPAPADTASSAPPPPTPAATAEPPAPPKPKYVTIPAGTTVAVRMIDGIDSGKNQPGQTFRASLSQPITADGEVAVPAGGDATVVLTAVQGAGRLKGQSEVAVRLASIAYHGRKYEVTSDTYSEQGKGGRGKQSAIRTGIGAGIGAAIGALAGGGKGAAIGSVAGGGAGAGYQLATHGQQVKLPPEAILTFKLEAPLRLREHSRGSDEQ
jgi:hypothetical protein